MIFSRKRGSGRHSAGKRDRDHIEADVVDDDEEAAGTAPAFGPYDIDEISGEPEGFDLGSLHVPVLPGVDLGVQGDPDGKIHQVLLASGESALQLSVVAAPRTEGIWDEVRAEIRQQITGEGGVAEEIAGTYGTELRARVRTPEGPADVRFVGIDGPRWMVHAVYRGAAALDPEAAGPLTETLRGVVVDRGPAAMPVREPLPLRLPPEIADQVALDPDPSGGAGPVPGSAGTTPAASGSGEDAAPERKPAAAGQGISAGRRRPSPRRRRS